MLLLHVYIFTESDPGLINSIGCNVHLISEVFLSPPCTFVLEKDGDFYSKRIFPKFTKLDQRKNITKKIK